MPKTICVIDDEPQVREALEAWLDDAGYRVVKAAGGDEAMRLIAGDRPHLILLDLIMPDRDGFDVLTELKQNAATRAIPVVMLTAKGDSDAIFRAREMKASDFVTKPFETDDLLRVIRRYESDGYSYRHPSL